MNKNIHPGTVYTKQSDTVLIILLILTTTFLLTFYREGQASSSVNETAYLPLAASSSRTSPPAAYSTSIELPDAQCPNDIAVNQSTGYVYITNEYSDNVSLLRGTNFLGNIATGNWPIWVESDPQSERVYVSNVLSGVTVMEGDVIKKQIDPYHGVLQHHN